MPEHKHKVMNIKSLNFSLSQKMLDVEVKYGTMLHQIKKIFFE